LRSSIYRLKTHRLNTRVDTVKYHKIDCVVIEGGHAILPLYFLIS
jgi:hypothetical protein